MESQRPHGSQDEPGTHIWGVENITKELEHAWGARATPGESGACMAGYHIGYWMALYDVYVRSAVADPERTSSGCAGVDCLGMELCQLCSRQGDDSAKLAQAAVMPCKHVCACADCVEDLVVRSPDCHPTYSTLSLCGCSDVARKR